MKATLFVCALINIGCAYETTSKGGDEPPTETSAAVSVRAKTVTFEPLQLCDGWVRDAEAAGLTCTDSFGNPCAVEIPRLGAGSSVVGPVLARWNSRFTQNNLFFSSNDPKLWIDLNVATWVRAFSSVSCHRTSNPPDARVNYAAGIPPGRTLLITETIFEHIRDVDVRGRVDVQFVGEGAADGAIEVALQSADANGEWKDHAVTRSTFVGYLSVTRGPWVGNLRQVLEVSATLPANELVLVRVRGGAGTVGKATGTRIEHVEFRGEECVPSNIPGECL